MKLTGKKVDRLIPNNISDLAFEDDDSGLRVFRGIISPWDQIKSFRESYHFLMRNAAMFDVAYMNALKVIEPDYEKRQTVMSRIWGDFMKYLWSPSDPFGAIKGFESDYDIPPFIKQSVYRSGCYADSGDEFTDMAGQIHYASSGRVEKEIHTCPIDIIGPDACDLSIGGGQHFCVGCAATSLNVYLEERMGCGDPYCHTTHEMQSKYGGNINEDGYDWECWGPPGAEMRRKGAPRKKEVKWLTTGEYVSPLNARKTAGEMRKQTIIAPLAYAGHAAGAIREFMKDDMERAQYIVNASFDTAGKLQFAEATTRKSVRDWMGVPPEVDDGRVLGGYISMILQARGVPWSFLEFTEERVVIDLESFPFVYMGQYPEFIESHRAWFDAMAKTLVNTQWIVKMGEGAEEGHVRYVIEKGLYGYRRQKPNYSFYDENESPAR